LMEDLRLLFLVIGAIAIAGILIHGLWSVRKNSASKNKQKFEPLDWTNDDGDSDNQGVKEVNVKVDADDPLLSDDAAVFTRDDNNGFDDLGLGQVQVVDESAQKKGADVDNEFAVPVEQNNQNAANETDTITANQPNSAPEVEPSSPKIYSSVVTQPKPEFAAEQLQSFRSKAKANGTSQVDDIPEPPPFLLKKDQENEAQPKSAIVPEQQEGVVDKVDDDFMQPLPEKIASAEPVKPPERASLAEQAKNLVTRKKAEAKPRKRKEPKVREDQMRIDFDEPQSMADVDESSDSKTAKQEVLVLNVKAPDDKPIQGAALLPMLLTLGFKFGDQDIFHRHVNSNGKGPVLFSLANMFKPGVFDIDNLENFTTQGISLFMILPIEGDPHQVFNMMHNAARKIADEFSSQVLDGRRSALNKQSVQQYVEKIREFERLRMIAR
jgi:cell division protein ZipA